MMQTQYLPPDEALFLGAATAHVAAYYERKRIQRIHRQNRLAALHRGLVR